MKRLLYPILITLLFVGCKPTEKGYQAAYDAAKNKREAAAREQMLPAQGLQSDDGPQLRVVDGDSIYVLRAIMRTEDSKRAPAPWLLAVGVYRMSTNAKANAQRLQQAGYPRAVWLKGPENKWYTISDYARSLDSLKTMSRRFKNTHSDYPYIGLPASPVIINAF